MKVRRQDLLICALLAACPALHADDAMRCRAPGDKVNIEVTFDGPAADKIQLVDGRFDSKTPRRPDQPNFSTYFAAAVNKSPDQRAFSLVFQVPPDAADGEYSLSIDAHADIGSESYPNSPEFPRVTVCNASKFVPPRIHVREVTGRP